MHAPVECTDAASRTFSLATQSWTPDYLWNDRAIRIALRHRVEYLPGLSGSQMNQNLWLAAYIKNWAGAAHAEICGYYVPEESVLPVHLFCTHKKQFIPNTNASSPAMMVRSPKVR
uniref:Uncharacterized protein n=1 Tax=Chrysotila carterae TaxID=13221 RepID=A0A7S4C6Y2_CHRCT